MRVLFVYHPGLLRTGGIEVLFVNYARYIRDNGGACGLLVPSGGVDENLELVKDFRKFGEIHEVSFFFPSTSLDQVYEKYEVVFATNAWSFVFAITCPRLKRQGLPVAIGSYHFNDYLFPGWESCNSAKLLDELMSKQPPENFLWYSSGNVLQIEKLTGRDYSKSSFLPVALPDEGALAPNELEHPIRILNIGRYTAFKRHCFRIIELMKSDASLSKKFHFSFYGHGEDEQALRSAAEGLTSVTVHGPIQKEEIRKQLDHCHFFFGMGTSLTGAAMAGKPSIVAVPPGEQDKSTYGLYGIDYKVEYGVGDYVPGCEMETIASVLRRLLLLSPSEYQGACAQTREFALSLSEQRIMPRFFQFLSKVNASRFWPISLRYRMFLIRAIESLLAKILKKNDLWATKLNIPTE